MILAVRDENDNVPSFKQNKYWGQISEAAPLGSVVIETQPPNDWLSYSYHPDTSDPLTTRPLVITAQDLDSDHNSNLFFEIVDPPARNMFRIDSATGDSLALGCFLSLCMGRSTPF